MKKHTGWYRPDQAPARRGYYDRDHSAIREHMPDLKIWRDLWEPVPKDDPRYPGIWWIRLQSGAIIESFCQQLPWRGLQGVVVTASITIRPGQSLGAWGKP